MLILLGYTLMLVGGINMAWFVFWLIMAWSATSGAQISKQVKRSLSKIHRQLIATDCRQPNLPLLCLETPQCTPTP